MDQGVGAGVTVFFGLWLQKPLLIGAAKPSGAGPA